MSKILTVAKWEYLEKVKTKAFIIGLFLTPGLMIAMSVLPTFFINQEDKDSRVIGIIDQSGELAFTFAQRMQERYKLVNGQPNYVVRPLAIGPGINLEEEIADANAKTAADELEGYCIVHGTSQTDSTVEYRSKAVGDFRIGMRIEEVLKGIIADKRIAAIGLDPRLARDLNVQLDVKMVKLSKAGEREEAGFEKVFFSAYLFMMALFLMIVTSGQMLVRSVIEEKSNRIVEVLVSSCSPTELMAGKVLGLSGLAFTQMGFWALMGIAVSLQFGMTLVEVGPGLLLMLYFVLGYLFYAAVFIGAGSPLTTEQEAQQVTSYLVIILILPIVLALPAMKTPEATWLKVLTYIPFLTPTMMALRIPIQMPSFWEFVATIMLMVVSICVAMIAAGRIFRIAVLSTGKSPKIAEIIRWAITG